MSSDLRTQLNDCQDDTQTFATTGAQLGTNTLAGNTVISPNSVETQHSNVYDDTYTSGDSAGATFNLGSAGADMTIFIAIKDNGYDVSSVVGAGIVLGDGTDRIGYSAGGSDALGMPMQKVFNVFKLDTSDAAANPGTADVDHHVFAGTEANLDFTNITIVGYGGIHNAKAQGNVVNCFISGIYYNANSNYDLRINGGTVGTPETMADVVGDDETNGWGLVSNPIADAYYFIGSTEWGEPAANADAYFSATNEQWFLLGDNGGGRAMGAGNQFYRVIGNATDTISFDISNIVLVNTGTAMDFDFSDTNIDTCTLEGCTFINLGAISLPDSTITTGSSDACIFSGCGQVTNNGKSMVNSSISGYEGTAGTGALLYNENADPDGELDGMSFSKGTAATAAIEFGTSVPASPSEMTLRDMDFTGYNASDAQNDSHFRILDTTGTIIINLIGCTTDAASFSYNSAGATVSLVIDPVTCLVNVKDNDALNLQNARVLLEASDATGDFPYHEPVTITRVGDTASVAHTAHGMISGDYVVIRGPVQPEYRGVFQISNVTTNAYDITVPVNLFLRSQELDNTGTWPGGSTTRTAGQLDPENTLTAVDILFTADITVRQDAITIEADEEYCISFYAKQGLTGTHDWIQIRWRDDAAANGIEAWYRLDTGAVGTSQTFGAGTTLGGTGIEDVGGGWYRCYIYGTLASGIASGRVTIDNTQNDASAVSETTDSVIWWGAQLEKGQAPTKYKPTDTAAVPVTPATAQRVEHNQDETDYVASFSGGSGHVVSDVLTLDRNVLVTVDAVSVGAVTQFTVDSTESQSAVEAADVLNQRSTTGAGSGFSLTLAAANISISSNGAIFQALTNASGNASRSRSFTNSTPVRGYARKSTTSPRFKSSPLAGTIDNTAGLTINVQLIIDE